MQGTNLSLVALAVKNEFRNLNVVTWADSTHIARIKECWCGQKEPGWRVSGGVTARHLICAHPHSIAHTHTYTVLFNKKSPEASVALSARSPAATSLIKTTKNQKKLRERSKKPEKTWLGHHVTIVMIKIASTLSRGQPQQGQMPISPSQYSTFWQCLAVWRVLPIHSATSSWTPQTSVFWSQWCQIIAWTDYVFHWIVSSPLHQTELDSHRGFQGS